jgi:hypothetical protein
MVNPVTEREEVASRARAVPSQSISVTVEPPVPTTATGREALPPQLSGPYTPGAMKMVTTASQGVAALATSRACNSVPQGARWVQGAVSFPVEETYRGTGVGELDGVAEGDTEPEGLAEGEGVPEALRERDWVADCVGDPLGDSVQVVVLEGDGSADAGPT